METGLVTSVTKVRYEDLAQLEVHSFLLTLSTSGWLCVRGYVSLFNELWFYCFLCFALKVKSQSLTLSETLVSCPSVTVLYGSDQVLSNIGPHVLSHNHNIAHYV